MPALSKKEITLLLLELQKASGQVWDIGQPEEFDDCWLRPMNILNPIGLGSYRFGIYLYKIKRDLYEVGLDITHNREVAKIFAKHLLSNEGYFSRQEIAGHFRRLRQYPWTVATKDKPATKYLKIKFPSGVEIENRFSGLPRKIRKIPEGNVSKNTKALFSHFDVWEDLSLNFPAKLKNTGDNPLNRADAAGSYFRLTSIVKKPALSGKLIWDNWKHSIFAFSIKSELRSGIRLSLGWKRSKVLWNEFLSKNELDGDSLKCMKAGCNEVGRKRLQLDHFIPKEFVSLVHRKRADYDSVKNLVPLCFVCHRKKTLEQKYRKASIIGNRLHIGNFTINYKELKSKNKYFELMPFPRI